MPGRILAVGCHSFLAKHALAALDQDEVEAVGHDDIERPGLLEGVGCIVNFCRDPVVANDAYGTIDLRLAHRIGDRDIA